MISSEIQKWFQKFEIRFKIRNLGRRQISRLGGSTHSKGGRPIGRPTQRGVAPPLTDLGEILRFVFGHLSEQD